MRLLPLLLVAATVGCAHAPPRAPIDPPRAEPGEAPATTADRVDAPRLAPYRIILVGDSTMAPNSGWGGAFCAHHVKWRIACLNLARGARSTRSYRAEGAWDVALAEMRVPGYVATFVLIQMGHNDAARNKPERWTDEATEFPSNLRAFVEETRAAGAIPILVTPLARRDFLKGTLVNSLASWSARVREAAAMTHAPLIDLNARSAAQVQAIGAEAAMAYAQMPPGAEERAAARTGTTLPPPPSPPGNADDRKEVSGKAGARGQPSKKFDYTHLGDEGAEVFASMVADDLATIAPELAAMILP